MQKNYLTKFNIHLLIKNFQQSGYRDNIAQHNNGHGIPTAAIVLDKGKLEAFSPRSGTREDAHSSHFYST